MKKIFIQNDIMKYHNHFIFFLIFIFSLIACSTNNNLIFETNMDNSTNNFAREDRRFFEESGGYSIILPELWEAAEASGYDNKVLFGPEVNNYTPVIGFTFEAFSGELNEFVNRILNDLNMLFGEKFKLLKRDAFVTLLEEHGEKIVINVFIGERHFRQTIYFFSKNENSKILIVCTVPAETDSVYDAIFDRTIKTFEWTKNYLATDKKRFIEEAGGFSIIPPEPWREAKFQNINYKVLILESEYTSFISPDICAFSGELDEFVDSFIEQSKVDFRDFLLIKREYFCTLKQLEGIKTISTVLNYNEQYIRFIIYFFPVEKEKKILLISCAIPAEANDVYDVLIDKMMETLVMLTN